MQPHWLQHASFPVLHHLLEFAQTHVHWVSDAIQPSHPVSPSPPTFNHSQHQGLFQWGSSSHQVATVLEFQLLQGIFRTDFLYNWLVWSPCCPRDSQESSPTAQLKSINSLCSAFFIVQLSHPYMTTGKAIALTRWTLVDKVMSLLFNMLPTLVITFLTRSKHLLISWLQLPSAVILEPKEIKSDTVSENCKSKPQWGTISWWSEWLLSKILQTINAGECVEKGEPPYTVGGNAN